MIRDPAEEYGPEPPPCELSYAGRVHQHPRYPSGVCSACGALPEQTCRWGDRAEHERFERWRRADIDETEFGGDLRDEDEREGDA